LRSPNNAAKPHLLKPFSCRKKSLKGGGKFFARKLDCWDRFAFYGTRQVEASKNTRIPLATCPALSQPIAATIRTNRQARFNPTPPNKAGYQVMGFAPFSQRFFRISDYF
jgi:hypothetical protein